MKREFRREPEAENAEPCPKDKQTSNHCTRTIRNAYHDRQSSYWAAEHPPSDGHSVPSAQSNAQNDLDDTVPVEILQLVEDPETVVKNEHGFDPNNSGRLDRGPISSSRKSKSS